MLLLSCVGCGVQCQSDLVLRDGLLWTLRPVALPNLVDGIGVDLLWIDLVLMDELAELDLITLAPLLTPWFGWHRRIMSSVWC